MRIERNIVVRSHGASRQPRCAGVWALPSALAEGSTAKPVELDFALPALAIHHAQRRSDDFELPVP